MTTEISLVITLLVITGVTVYLTVTVRAVQQQRQRADRERLRLQEDHLRVLVSFAGEYGVLVRKSRAWKTIAKKYHKLYKEGSDV